MEDKASLVEDVPRDFNFAGLSAPPAGTHVVLNKKPLAREVELDFIRGIAILLVMDRHSNHSIFGFFHLPEIGYVGVNMFFVLSGFLVGGLLMKEWKVRRGIDAKRFFVRRAFKIWPPFYILLFANMAFGSFTFAYARYSLVHIQNYEPGGMSHLWSLAVEEHTYLLLGICLWVASRRKIAPRLLFLFFASICFFEIILRYLYSGNENLYFKTHFRVDGILYGVLLAMLYHFAPQRFEALRSWRPLWYVCWTVSTFGLMLNAIPAWSMALWADCGNVFAISSFLLLYTHSAVERKHGLLYRLVAWIGLYSYGIYLWHINVISAVDAYSRHHPKIPVFFVGPAMFVASIAFGVVATRLIELPFLRLRDRMFHKRVDSAVGTPAVVESPPAPA